jgi:hypothetical protein
LHWSRLRPDHAQIAPDIPSQPSFTTNFGGHIYLSITRQGFVVGVQDMASALDQVDGNLVSQDLWEMFAEVIIQHIKQFRRKLHSGWPATTNHE